MLGIDNRNQRGLIARLGSAGLPLLGASVLEQSGHTDPLRS